MKKYIKSIRLIPMKVDCKDEEWYHVRFFLDDGSTVERAWWVRIPAGWSDTLYRYIFNHVHDAEWCEHWAMNICVEAEKICWYWVCGVHNMSYLDELHKFMEEE